MDVCTLGLPCAVLFSALLLVAVSGSQTCAPQVIPDMVIDVGQAMARGAHLSGPLSCNDVEQCLSACCMRQDTGDDRDCNLLVFDTRKGPGRQNCYIFHCPSMDSCPLMSSPGVFSYSLWSETPRPQTHDPDKAQQRPKSSDRSKTQASGSALLPSSSAESSPLHPNNKKPSAAIVSQGSAKHYGKEEAANPKSITTQLLHLADTIDQHLEKMESKSGVHHSSPAASIVPVIRTTTVPVHKERKKGPPDTKMANPGRVTSKKPEDLKIYFPTEAAKTAGTVPHRTTPRLSTAVLPAMSWDESRSKVPSSALDGSDSSHGTKKVDRPLPHSEIPAPTRPLHVVTAPIRTSPWKGIKPTTKTIDRPSTGDEGEMPGRALPESPPTMLLDPAVNLEGDPRKAGSAKSVGALSSLEDKSGLVAALIFGTLFLLVVIGLVSRKVSDARRRHRYTKLDYLINGMYVDT